MVAYRAKTALVRCLTPHYAKTEDDGRALIREILLTSADILPDDHRLVVRLHSLANPRSNDALIHLCEALNSLEVRYPGTELMAKRMPSPRCEGVRITQNDAMFKSISDDPGWMK